MTSDRHPSDDSTGDSGPADSGTGSHAVPGTPGQGQYPAYDHPGYSATGGAPYAGAADHGEAGYGGDTPVQQSYGPPYPGAGADGYQGYQGYQEQPGGYGAPYPDHAQSGGGEYGYGYTAFGYGPAGPQYGQPGYGQPGYPSGPMPGPNDMGTPSFSATGAVGAAWRLFSANWVPWVVISLVNLVLAGIINVAPNLLLDPQTVDTDPWLLLGVSSVSSMVAALLSLLVTAFMVRGALLEVDGRRPSVGDFFRLTNFLQFFLVSILVGVLTAVGLLALLVGALVVQFFLYWSNIFTIDRDQNAIDAIKSSFESIKANAGELFLLAVLNVVIVIAGAMLCGVGLLVAAPVTMLSSVYAYRVLTGPSGFSDREMPAPLL